MPFGDAAHIPFVALFADPRQLLPALPFDEQAKNLIPTHQGQSSLWGNQPDKSVDAFRQLLNAGKTPLFAGIEDIAALSSGCIRILIEIIHRVITHALIRNPELLIQEGCIPPDIQHEAINIETDQRFSQELNTTISATTKEPAIQRAAHNVLDSLLKKFAKSLDKEPTIHSFQVKGDLSSIDDGGHDVAEAISVLDRLGLVTQLQSGIQDSVYGQKYSVSRIFAPKYGLPPIEYGCLTMTVEELHRTANPHWKQRNAAEQSLPLTEPLNCFYATGFRSEWENAL